MSKPSANTAGFTIVELLIVIVVIGILAAITIVSYSGIQSRAQFAAYRTDIDSLNKAILLYYTDNGYYPMNGVPAGSCATNVATGSGDFITGLAPTYMRSVPSTPNWSSGANYYAYCWTVNGTNYKVLRLVPGGSSVPTVELNSDVNIDPTRGNRGWGFWSSGGSAL